jgi:hypothetical protein
MMADLHSPELSARSASKHYLFKGLPFCKWLDGEDRMSTWQPVPSGGEPRSPYSTGSHYGALFARYLFENEGELYAGESLGMIADEAAQSAHFDEQYFRGFLALLERALVYAMERGFDPNRAARVEARLSKLHRELETIASLHANVVRQRASAEHEGMSGAEPVTDVRSRVIHANSPAGA